MPCSEESKKRLRNMSYDVIMAIEKPSFTKISQNSTSHELLVVWVRYIAHFDENMYFFI